MKYIHNRLTLFIILFIITGLLPIKASAGYKITANIVDMGQVCFITGQVKDVSGNPVHPAEVTFKCGDTTTKVSTLTGGYYINNPPICVSDFEITATAPGQKPTSLFSSVQENELKSVDLSLPAGASLEDAILTLQILCNMDTGEKPFDQNQDSLIGLEDAIMNIQYLAGLREDGGTTGQSVGRFALSSSYKNVKLWSDTNGDGVEELILDVTTDEYGYIELNDLSEGNYTLIASSSGNDNAVRLENIKIAGQSIDLKTVQLKPVGSISGAVQLEGKTDHTGIQVYIPGTSYTAKTDSQGSFTISNVAEGTYNLRAEKPNFGTIIVNDIPVNSGQDNSIDETFIMPSVVGEVNGTATLNGMTDHAGILMTLRKNTGTTFMTTTDTAGAYAFADIPVGQYTLEAGKQGYVSQQSVIDVQSRANQPDDITLYSNINTGTLSGTITLNNISDYSGILVSLAGTGYLAITDDLGSFIINDIPEGTYTVFLNSEGYKAKKVENVSIQAGNTTGLTESLIASSSLQDTEKKNGSIIGTVKYLDKTNHAGIGVKVEGTTLFNSSDSNGAFIIENVPSGTYTLTFTESNHKTIIITGVVVSPWSTAFIEDVVMIPLFGKIIGTVNLEGETDYSGVLISVDNTSVTAVSSQDGAFTLYPLLEGNNYTLRFSKQDFENESLTDQIVVAGQTTDLTDPIVLKIRPDPPTGISTSYLTNTSVKVTWQASVSGDVTGYDVYYGTAQDQINTKATPSLITSQIGGEWTYTVTGLTSGSDYWFALRSIDADTLESDLSALAQPDPMGEITGTVHLEGETDHSGISVSVDGTSITAVTDSAGKFTLTPLTADTYTLRFSKTGFVEKTLDDVSVTAGQTLNITDTVSIQKATGNISGQAYLEGSTFDQYGDITVSLVGTTINTLTNAYGAFTLTLVPSGTYTVRAIKENFIADEIADFQVVPGQSNSLPNPLILKKPPEPPTGVTAVQTSGSSVNVSWTESTSNDVSGYNVYYGTASDTIDTKANTDLVSGTSFEVTGLDKGITFYFAVEAVDNDSLVSDKAPSDGSCTAVIHPSWEATVITGNYAFNLPFDIALTADGSKGYASSRQNACLLTINFDNNNPYVSSQINLTGISPQPTAMAINSVNGNLYVIDNNQSKLFVLNTTTDQFTGSVSVDGSPQNVIVSSDGSKIYVCSSSNDLVTVIDSATLQIDTTVTLNSEDADPYGMAIAKNKLYVIGTWTGKVYVIDIDSQSVNFQTVIGIIAVGDSAYDAVASSDGSYVYVSHDTADGKISVIDTNSDALGTSITIKNSGESTNKNPRGIAVAGNILYIVNWADSTVTMINTDTNTKLVLDSPLLSGGNGPENIVVSPDSNKLYIVHSSVGSVEILSY